MDYTPYKLKHWIKQDKIEWKLISLNPRAIDIINDKILSGDNYLNWNGLSMNPNGPRILENHIDKIEWDLLSRNPNA